MSLPSLSTTRISCGVTPGIRVVNSGKVLSPYQCDRRSEREGYTYMIALHEQEMERRAWLSTDAREEFPFLRPLDEQDKRRPIVAHDDDVFKALEQDDTTWDDTDAEEAPL